jgi:hypothetical protein
MLGIVMSDRARGLVAEAAEEAGCKPSVWARQKLYEALRASGRDPVTFERGTFDSKTFGAGEAA